MAEQVLDFNSNSGGISPNSKSGLPHSARFTRFLDIWSDNDSTTLNPAAIKDSDTTVTDLGKWMVEGSPFDANKYALGDTGKLYKITSGGAYSNPGTSTTSHGNGLVTYNNFVYVATDETFDRYGPLSGGGTAAFTANFLGTGTNDLDQSNTTATGNTYTVPVAIAETATNLLTFVPTKDPIKYVVFKIVAKGTGNWTLTIHDAQNAVVYQQTYSNASLSNGTFTFNLTSPYARIQPGKAYHFHLTSTVADGTVTTNTGSDLSTAYYEEHFSYLVVSPWHPIITHTDGTKATIVFGNGRYLGVWDDGTYSPNQIVLENGYEVRDLIKENGFAVALCWKGTTIDGSEEGRAYYWDGISPYFNDMKPITGGMPNAAVNFKNRLFSVLGSEGAMNLGEEPFNLIQNVPQLVKGKKIEVYPGAIDVWRSKAVIGFGVNTDDSVGLEQGVYEYGSQSDREGVSNSEVLNFGYRISTGTTQSTSMSIGCVKSFGKDLYIWWKDGSNYGADKVSKTGIPSPVGSWESLLIDLGSAGKGALQSMPWKEKLGIKVVVSYLPLPVGCTVTPKYKIDREASWHLANIPGVAGTTRAEVLIGGLGAGRYHEIQIGYDLTATINYPTILGAQLMFDPFPDERVDG